MFSGIIEHKGMFEGKMRRNNFEIICIRAAVSFIKKIKIGASVSVSGVCLTLLEKKKNELFFEVMPETLRKTGLGDKKNGFLLNLEPALCMGEEVGGHFVYGHVDAIGEIVKFDKEENGVLLSIKLPTTLRRYVCLQGSITIDGVSLTIARIKGATVTVSLVDYTLHNTTLGDLKVGNRVNIECDMIAKYVERILKHA
jgi:riboflavin synthase